MELYYVCFMEFDLFFVVEIELEVEIENEK